MRFTEKVFPSGLRLITVPMADNPTVTVLVLTGTGSEFETKDINGISHFLEHLCFKGTINRPTSVAISVELDGIGAEYNAFTGEEYTGYYAKAHARHYAKVLDVVSDIFLNPTFPEVEIEKERGVVIGEIDMYEDTPQRTVGDVLTELLYRDQTAGFTILGEKENIRSLKRDNFVAYRGKHYVAETTTIIVTGGIDEDVVTRDVEALFKDIASDARPDERKTFEDQRKPEVSLREKKTNQTHLMFGWRSCHLGDGRAPSLEMLAGVLSAGMSSRLFQRIREELGLGYYVRASNELFLTHGFLGIGLGVDNDRVEEAVVAIINEVKRLKDELVSPEELTKVKDCLSGTMYLGLEQSDDVALFYGMRAVLHQPILTPQEWEERIRAVTAEDIKRVAEDIFVSEKTNLALIGPHQDKDKLALRLLF
ncbi:MAG TPA: pitrilysin family protein [Candidatus Paceibacterota bacterium]